MQDDADSNETDIECGEKKRPSWDNKFQYIMAALGLNIKYYWKYLSCITTSNRAKKLF